ncbi:thermonuclease family protein [Yoonia sp. 208BN28-4]|uniref:thermonuclease family protein n=1 Tax=Yoonia sp. 208BN28-4 TaxID=3126505 RepID=UPI0030A81B8D
MELGVLILVAVIVWLCWPKTRPSEPLSSPPRKTAQPSRRPKPQVRPKKPAIARGHQLKGLAYVIDGDSLRIKKTEIRLFGVDAPEFHHPFGKMAKSKLIKLVKGHVVCAEIIDSDDHNRCVAICYLADGRDLSAEMVKANLALDWPKFSGGAYKHLEPPDARRRMWLADARQRGHMHVWAKFDAQTKKKSQKSQ